MRKMTTLNVRIGAGLGDFVSGVIGERGDYDNASEYVRDLIRRDKARAETDAFEAKRAALQQAFALPDHTYSEVSLDDVVTRNLSKRA